MRKRAAFGQLSAQTARQAPQTASRARLAAEPVLRATRLPQAQDAAVAALPRTQGVFGGDDHRDPARGRHTSAHAAADRAHQRRPQNRRGWRTWWRDAFTATPFWQIARASFMPPADEARLPGALLERFAGNSLTERMVALLRFLGPITGGQMQALQRLSQKGRTPAKD